MMCLHYLLYASGTQQPTYSLIRDRTYAVPFRTQRLDVEFYVRNEAEFEKGYQRGSSARYRIERSVSLQPALHLLCSLSGGGG